MMVDTVDLIDWTTPCLCVCWYVFVILHYFFWFIETRLFSDSKDRHMIWTRLIKVFIELLNFQRTCLSLEHFTQGGMIRIFSWNLINWCWKSGESQRLILELPRGAFHLEAKEDFLENKAKNIKNIKNIEKANE